jgi:O-antigen/teichoic acid export membrane protein
MITGVSWMGSFRITFRLIGYIKLAILARLLTPEQFGLFGIAALVFAFLEITTETGINVFLIQEKTRVDKYLNTAWVVSIVRGIIISVFVLILAPFIASFFGAPNAKNLIMLIATVPLIRGLINPSVVSLDKDLKFKSEFFLRSTVFLFDTIVAIIVALQLRTASSLVYGLIASAIAEVMVTHLFIKPKPRLHVDTTQFKRIIKRGKWVTLAGTANYFVEHIDDIMVGRIINTNALGIYQMAYKLSLLPLTEVTQVIGKVSFPVYVKISGDKTRLKKAFIKTSLVTTIIAALTGATILMLADFIVSILLGPNWISVTPILRVLAIFGILRATSSVQFVLFNSLKQQHLVAKSLLIEFVALFAILIPFINKFGTIGAAYATLFAVLVPLPFIALNSYKLLFSND